MDAGRLDRRIVLLRSFTAVDSFNSPIETWSPLVAVWASATPVSDGERMQAGQTLANKTYRFVIRYSTNTANLDPRDRLTFDGRTYDIQGVKEIGRRKYLEITAAARAETP